MPRSTRYRKKPIVIEAIPWTGKNLLQVAQFLNLSYTLPTVDNDHRILIHTLEGRHWASVGDMVIRGVNNEIYACKPDIFRKTYELAEPVS